MTKQNEAAVNSFLEEISTMKKSKTQRFRPHPRVLENFLLIWLDVNLDDVTDDECQTTVDQLRAVVNSINTFSDVNHCVDFLSDIKDEKAFMIISGSLGQQIVSYIHGLPQLHSIYVYCASKTRHEEWAKDWSKIKGVFTQIGPICESLKQSIHECEQNFISLSFVTANEVSGQNLDQLDQSFMYTQILKEILFEIQYTDQAVKDLISFCREQYAGNQNELSIIDGFERNYRRKTPIWWYTYPSFVHSMLNRALRTHEVDSIIKMGFFIQDLHRQIEQLHKEQSNDEQKRSFTVYRGQGLSKQDFEKLIRAKGGLMSFNSFLSTSKKRKISLEFAQDALNNLETIGILFKMIIEPANISTPYAVIDDVSYFSSEQEILFSMHTIFRIGEIKEIENHQRLYQVELKLTSIKNQQLIALTDRLREETSGSTGWHRLGMLLIKLGRFDKAEQVYNVLFESSAKDKDKALLYHQLGLIKRNQGDYYEALVSYQKALEVYRTTLDTDHPDLATSYNNIGQVYTNMGEYSKALRFYQHSLDIYEKTLPPDHSSLAIPYNNIGLVHRFLGDYAQALVSHEKALNIEERTLPANHPSLAISYNNIGLVYKYMGEYAKALESHEKALQIEEKTLPSDHPSLAISYNNIGLLYDNMGEYAKALSFYEKTLAIYQKSSPNKHPDLATAYNNIGSVYKNIGEYSKALWFYERTLEIEGKALPEDHPSLAITFSNIGMVYNNLGDLAEALSYHEKALAIREKIYPADHRMLATSYNNIGSVYDTMGNYTKALAFYEKTLAIEQKILPANHPDLATSYNNMGLVYDSTGDDDQALSYHQKALEIYEKTLSAQHPDLANSYNNLALVCQKMGDFTRALLFYEKALDIRQKILPAQHPDLATSYANLCALYQTIGENAKAHSCYKQSVGSSSNSDESIPSYSTIDRVYDSRGGSEKTTSLPRPFAKLRIAQLPNKFRNKNFRVGLALRLRTKKK
jgi:tetratricopeptide (TPR) repeat protein